MKVFHLPWFRAFLGVVLLGWGISESAWTEQIKIGPPAQEIVNKAIQATVVIRTPGGRLGSGFFVSKDGRVLTNYHVIEGASRAIVELRDGRRMPVLGVLAYSSHLDLAVLKIQPGEYEYLKLEEPEKITHGVPLFAIGHPHGHTWTLTTGYLAGKRTERNRPVIQFSTDISPGNSGGPVLNYEGRVCGIATYLENHEIRFRNGSYVLDPSDVLKFGIAVEAFARIPTAEFEEVHSLAELSEYQRKLEAVNFIAAVVCLSHELLKDLHVGIKNLSVEVKRSYDTSYRHIGAGARGRHPLTGSQTLIFDTGRFQESAILLAAISMFLDQYVPQSTGDPYIDQTVSEWRSSMNAAIRSIRAVYASSRTTESTATEGAERARREFGRSTSAMYKALEMTEKLIFAYGPRIRNPLFDETEISELKTFYYNRGLSL